MIIVKCKKIMSHYIRTLRLSRKLPVLSAIMFFVFASAAATAIFHNPGHSSTEGVESGEKRIDAVLAADRRPAARLPDLKGGTVYLIPSSGQSNSIGAGGGPPRLTNPVRGNLFAVQAGRKITRLSEPTISAVDPNLKESHVTAMGRMFAEGKTSHDCGCAYVFSSHGMGGEEISALRKGGSTGSYEDLLKTVSLVKEAADRVGAKAVVPYVVFIHGEGDAALKLASTYYENLAGYSADLSSDIPAITAQKEPVRLVISQVSGSYGYFSTVKSWADLWQIKQSQLLLSLVSRDVVLAGPTYQLPLVKGKWSLHFTSEGYEMLGEMMAKAMRYMSETGRKWVPLSPKSVRQEKGKVVVAFHVPAGPLRWDEKMAAPDRGFELFDRKGRVRLKSISLRDEEVVLHPSRPLSGRVRVRYGYRPYAGNPAGGGSLTDSDRTVSLLGFSLRNYCVLFQMRQTGQAPRPRR